MHRNFVGNAFVLPGIAATAAGVTTITGPTIDHGTGSSRSIAHIARLGTATAGQTSTVKVYHGDASDMSDEVAVPGLSYTVLDGDSGNNVVQELYKPTKRYSRQKIARSGANLVIESGLVILSHDRVGAFTPPASQVGNQIANV